MSERRPLNAALALAGGALAFALIAGALWGDDAGVSLLHGDPGSFAEADAIFLNNLTIAAMLAAAVAVVALSSPQARGWRRGAFALVAFVLLGNVVVWGFALGALGPALLPRVLPHAAFELAAFAAPLWAFSLAWRGELRPDAAPSLALACVALLAAGALVESFISGSL